MIVIIIIIKEGCGFSSFRDLSKLLALYWGTSDFCEILLVNVRETADKGNIWGAFYIFGVDGSGGGQRR